MSRINFSCMIEFWFSRTLSYVMEDNLYKADELKDLNIKPKINDISLAVLQDYYQMFLMPFVYTYYVAVGDDVREFRLRFDSDKFCHLLGIESIARYHVKQKDLSNYRGSNGWNNISQGNIDFKHLKSLNKSKFQSVKAKFVYFYLIPGLIEEPLAVMFDGNKVNPPVSIESEMLFYSTYDNAVIHLGIDADDEGIYFPRTFFVEKLGSVNVEDIYTVNQTKIEVVKERRTILV